MKRVAQILMFLVIHIGVDGFAQTTLFEFLPNSIKKLTFKKDYAYQNFTLLDSVGGEVFKGTTTEINGKDSICIADFSQFIKSGNYTFKTHNSPDFTIKINDSVYRNLATKMGRYFYHMRSSEEIKEPFAEKGYARPPSQPDHEILVHQTAVTYDKTIDTHLSCPKGWINSGDYNKYVIASASATYYLLHTLDVYRRTAEKINLHIPESKDKTPDLLQEAVHNIEWLLSIQDGNDGGMFQKVTTKKISEARNPSEQKSDRFIVQKSTAATLSVAAVMAKASDVLGKYGYNYSKLSNRCLKGALKAWKWCLSNPRDYQLDLEGIETKSFNDTDLKDEWLWAASQMFIATRFKSYYERIKLKSVKYQLPDWNRVGTQSLYSIVTTYGLHKKTKEEGDKRLLKLADKFLKDAEKTTLNVATGGVTDASEIVQQGVLFLHAYRVSGDRKYVIAAENCLRFVLGYNPEGMSYIYDATKNNRVNDIKEGCYKLLYPYLLLNDFETKGYCPRYEDKNALLRMASLTYLSIGVDEVVKN